MKYKYIGCFLDFDALHAAIGQLGKARLARVIQNPHVTFVYRPDSVDEALFGAQLTLTVTGYASDGINEGLSVIIHTENAALQAMAKEIPVPHITISVSEDGEAVNTAKLAFLPIEPFELTGYFGGFCFDGSVDTQVR